MEKNFAQVFPSCKLNKTLDTLFSDVLVERVSTNKQKDFLRIYLRSDHLFPKQAVYDVEKEIKNQLFPKVNMTIKIQEKFSLSLYVSSNVFTVYWADRENFS